MCTGIVGGQKLPVHRDCQRTEVSLAQTCYGMPGACLGHVLESCEMELRLIMADPAGNRTAIVRSPVPVELRGKTAAAIMKIQDLRAEQVGFETAPVMGGAGRLEMMGGEFCGNAARSFGFLCFLERENAHQAERPDPQSYPLPDKQMSGNVPGIVPGNVPGDILIEISGSAGLLRVYCDPEQGTAFSEMPMPQGLEYTGEGYPLVISEGIAHMILEDEEPDPDLIHRMIGRYGHKFDAFGMQFLKGDVLIPVVYVGASDSLVYESSCGSGSLAAAWYLETISRERKIADMAADNPERERKNPAGSGTREFREPGGGIIVRLDRDENGRLHGIMGGRICMEEEISLSVDV